MSTGPHKLFLLLNEKTTKCCCLSLKSAFILIHILNIVYLILIQVGISYYIYPRVMMILSLVFFSIWILISLTLIIEILLNHNYMNGFIKRCQEVMCFSHCVGGLFYGLGLVMVFSNPSDPFFDTYIAIYYIIWGIIMGFEIYASYLTYSQFKNCELPDIQNNDDFQRISS